MSHEIFISYSSKHREMTRQLAAAIEARYEPGSVWWDHELEARGPYATQIRAALDAARVVVVIWSAGALVSEYVYAEAVAAHGARKLVNVRPIDTAFAQIPEPFNIHHVEDLGATERILRAIASVMAGRPLSTVVPLHELYFRQYGRQLVDTKQSALPADLLDISPSQLLQARYEQVGYVDATGQRAALLDWALGHPRRAAARLLHGPGGVGKTRLLIDLAAQLRRDHGWMAGFVEPVPAQADDAQLRQRGQALQQLVELGEDPGLLLVLDYAGGRQGELLELAQWMEARPDPARRPVRLVLLARSAGEWWQRLAQEHPSLQTLARSQPGWPAVLELPAFETPEQRLALLDASCAAYRPVLAAQRLAIANAEAPPALRQRIERGERHSRPLAIQMQALVWLAGGASNGESAGVAGLLDQVLGLERRHWVRVCGALDEAATTELERGLAQLVLVQAVPDRAAAEALLALDSYYQGSRMAPVQMAPALGRLGRLYGDGSEGLRPLEPDLLAEHLIGRAADARLLEACVAWVDAREDSALDDAPLRRSRLVTALQRATAPEHGPRSVARVLPLLDRLVESHLTRWASAVVSTVIETPGDLLTRLQARVASLDARALESLHYALPVRTIALATVALELARHRLEDEREASATATGIHDDSDHLARLAAHYGNYGSRLSAVGRREDALAATDEAVKLYRDLARDRPDVFLPDLATGLNNLGTTLSELGRHEDALAATDEALKIRRDLRDRPDAFLSVLATGLDNLATGLNNLGIRLSQLGRREDALAATDEAVTLYRDLASVRPDAFRPDLAIGLDTLGTTLSELGRREDALAASVEAVQINRALAQARPDAFLPALAISLNNLGTRSSKLGRREEALAATDEGMKLYRNLARDRPDAFQPHLAGSLDNLGNRLAELGRREEALAATDEAVKIRRDLAQDRPDAFLPDLAVSLHNLGIRLADVGSREEALAATDEATQIHRDLARNRPDAFLPALATSITCLGAMLFALGRREEALAATDEAVEFYRDLARDRPDAFRHDLAGSLNNLGTILSDLGRREDALAATDEAVNLYRDLALGRPDAFRHDLAGSLNSLGNSLSELGRREEALAATEEAVKIRRDLARDRPDAFLPDLAVSLHNLGIRLSEHGRREEALAAADEAVRIRRDLARDRPDAFRHDLARSLANLGNTLSDLGRREEALAATDEAVTLYRDIARDRPDAFLPELATSLGAHSIALAAAGQHSAAAASAEEGLVALLPLLRQHPDAFGQLAVSLAQIHSKHAEAAPQEPNATLLTEVVQVLGLDQENDGDAAARS